MTYWCSGVERRDRCPLNHLHYVYIYVQLGVHVKMSQYLNK
jgi:hypothetical protein